MGSGASNFVHETPGSDLRLPASGLRFSVNQQKSLNSYIDVLWEEDQKGRMSTELESTVESLVQRIVDSAGQRDPRFRCCHLIALHRGKKMRSRSLEYLVTLDALPPLNTSEDCKLVDGPVGYGRIRLTGKDAEKWEEFLTPSGYLCRDKVVERWVELVARGASARGGGASRALPAPAHARALPYTYCYLDMGSTPQTNTDRRLAIVEGAAWVMVRVGACEAEAKLMLGAKVHGCNAAGYTTRIPLTHPLALLHYTSAQLGYYAVAVGPPSSLVCGDRTSTWQLWHPSLEAELDAHCSELSTVARIAGALNALVDKMREGAYEGTLRVLSRYAAVCAARRRAWRCARLARLAARCVRASHAAHHLLLILDALYCLCERGGIAGYVYPVERGSVVRRGARDADWSFDAACIKSCLQQLHRVAGEDIPPSPSDALETALFSRWENLHREAKVAAESPPTYSRRQLRYLWRVASELLTCKNMLVNENHSTFRANLIQATSLNQESIEDLIHILAIMLDQARDQYLNNYQAKSIGEFDREMSCCRSKKWSNLKNYYDLSSACLIDTVRHDPDLHREDLKDPEVMMKSILKWLYKGAKHDKKYLGPVLKPYLDDIFAVSLENSWYLEDFDARKCKTEFDGLKEYCEGVHCGSLDVCMALLDAAKKFAWAKAMVDFVDRFQHIDLWLVFPVGDGIAVSYPIRLPSSREHSSARILTLSRRDKADAKLRLARRCVLGAFTNALVGEKRPKQKPISGHDSSDEILDSVKTGNYWRTTKPDIISSSSIQEANKETTDLKRVRRRTRRQRSATATGFPELSITKESDAQTLRRKFHTLKSLVYTEPVEDFRELRERPRSAGNTIKHKEVLSRPSILETLDFINTVKNALCVEESGASDTEDSAGTLEQEWLVGQAAPLNLIAQCCGANTLHLALGDPVLALLQSGKFTILQELCSFLGDASEGALFALHRLARSTRSRSSERSASSWRLPVAEGSIEAPQTYRARPPDYTSSGDEDPPPRPPLPRHSSIGRKIQVSCYPDYYRPSLIEIEPNINQLSLNPQKNEYTGIINPINDIKIPKNKFSVKRSKSLGRTFNTKLCLDMTKYTMTLGYRNGRKTNDVVTAITGMTAETGLEPKSDFFERFRTCGVVGDSYRKSKVTID